MSAHPEACLAQLQLHQTAAVLPQWLDRAAQEELPYGGDREVCMCYAPVVVNELWS